MEETKTLEVIAYHVINRHTGAVVKVYPCKFTTEINYERIAFRTATRYADKLDLRYGAAQYRVKAIFNK
jgi:hypothetical protein